MNKVIQSLVVLQLIVCSAYTQETEGSYMLSKMAAYYQNKEAYALNLDYKMYMGHKKDTLTESYSSQIFKNKEEFQMRTDGYNMYVFDDMQITLVIDEKQLYINEKTLNTDSVVMLKDIEDSNNNYDVIILEQSKNKASLKLMPKNKASVNYSQINMDITLPSYKVLNQTIFYNYEASYRTVSGSVKKAKPCLFFVINEYKGPKVAFLQKEDLITVKHDAITPSPTYKGFKLTDQRK